METKSLNLGALVDLLNGKKTYLAAALISAVTFFFPPAAELVQAYPDVAPAVIAILLAGLRAAASKPGPLAKTAKPAK